MNAQFVVRSGLAGALVLALAIPAIAAKPKAPPPKQAAAAPLKYQVVETWGWRAELPEGMEEVGKERKDPKKPHLSNWYYRSQKAGVRLRVKLKESNKKPGKKAAKRKKPRTLVELAKFSYLKFVKQFPESRVLRMRHFTAEGRDYAYIIAQVRRTMKKSQKKKTFMVLRLLKRAKRGVVARVTLQVDKDKGEQFVEIAEKLLDTFQLADVASVTTAAAQEKIETVNQLPPKVGGK